MTDIIQTIIAYAGTGIYFIIYVATLLVLLLKEKDKGNRIIFGYLPLVIAVLFLLPPVYKIYSRIDGADTYYRLLWLIPMTVTTIYSEVRFFIGSGRGMKRMLALMAVIAVLCGSSIYSKPVLVKAENRLHIPQDVIRVCDTITNDTQGEVTMAAMPSELLQFVRQYDSRIMMPYGREMLMPAYAEYYNPVYYQMEQTEVIDAEGLAQAIRENYCSYVVINAARQISGDLEEEGLELVSDLGTYLVYRNPDNELMIFNY